MIGYSRTKYEVFTLPKKLPRLVKAKVEPNTKVFRLNALEYEHWRQLREFQGRLTVLYLKWRYGSPETYILLAFVEQILAHVEWIVPAKKIKSRYPFVANDSYSIISCLTSERFRGLGIYTSQIQKVVESNISSNTFWIWGASTNIPSLKGIRKAGGVKVGEFVQEKWFWGCVSRIKYFPERGNDK